MSQTTFRDFSDLAHYCSIQVSQLDFNIYEGDPCDMLDDLLLDFRDKLQESGWDYNEVLPEDWDTEKYCARKVLRKYRRET